MQIDMKGKDVICTQELSVDEINALLKLAKEMKADDVNLWNNLGVCYIKLGMQKEGEEAFKKVDELEKK